MRTLNNINLHPVITLYPFYLGDKTYPYPESEDIDFKYRFWKEVLAERGLGKLEPIKKGLDYVLTNQVDDESLSVLVNFRVQDELDESIPENDISGAKKAIAVIADDIIEEVEFVEITGDEIEEEEEEDLPSSFEGGVILTSGEEIILIPQCCVSLQDHGEWLRLNDSFEVQRIWIGHPWIYVKREGDDILMTKLIEKDFDKWWKYYDFPANTEAKDFSDHIEKPGELIEHSDFVFRMNFIEFKAAVVNLKREAEHLINRSEQILIEQGIDNAAAIAACLVNGNGSMLSYSDENIT